MGALFNAEPIRRRPPRGEPLRARLGRGWHDPWPPPDRDPDDVAVLATRLLATAGRMEGSLRRVARRHGVDRRLLRFVLLFAERKAPLRVTDVADNMGVSLQTAGRIVTRAFDAGLVDVLNADCIDRREVAVRLTVSGRGATLRSLDAIRADAAAIAAELAPPRRGSSGAYGLRGFLEKAGPMDEGWSRG
jgi:DNA-binding MarR family transcriptional regulator